MKFSQIKAIKTFTENLFSEPCFREVVEEAVNDADDFEIDNVRFIKDSAIIGVLAEELGNDGYTLGCFNASFIASLTTWPLFLIEAAQAGEQFEALGRALLDEVDMEILAQDYASADGYGHHFNSYDGNSEEITIDGTLYHVFDNH